MPERLRPYVLEPASGTPPAWNSLADAIDMARVRAHIHAGRKIKLTYRDEQGAETDRVIWPITIGYRDTTRMLVAWCEMRVDFRSFRTDRVAGAEFLEDRYPERPAVLRAKWRRGMESERQRWMAKKAAGLPIKPVEG